MLIGSIDEKRDALGMTALFRWRTCGLPSNAEALPHQERYPETHAILASAWLPCAVKVTVKKEVVVARPEIVTAAEAPASRLPVSGVTVTPESFTLADHETVCCVVLVTVTVGYEPVAQLTALSPMRTLSAGRPGVGVAVGGEVSGSAPRTSVVNPSTVTSVRTPTNPRNGASELLDADAPY